MCITTARKLSGFCVTLDFRNFRKRYYKFFFIGENMLIHTYKFIIWRKKFFTKNLLYEILF